MLTLIRLYAFLMDVAAALPGSTPAEQWLLYQLTVLFRALQGVI